MLISGNKYIIIVITENTPLDMIKDPLVIRCISERRCTYEKNPM